MEIAIHDFTKLCEIQQEFNHHFHNLWIEFFVFAPQAKKKFLPEFLVKDTQKTIGEVRHLHRPGLLPIHGRQKLRTLQKLFREHFGLDVLFFLKSGTAWRQLTGNGDQSLSELNNEWKNTVKAMEDNVLTDYDAHDEQIN